MGSSWVGVALAAIALLPSMSAFAFDWTPLREESIVHVLTRDADGAERDTKVWIVTEDDAAYVRTNASVWLENLKRDPVFELRVGSHTYRMRAREVDDAAQKASIEEAFKKKYGTMQRIMSFFRFRDPTVLRLDPVIPTTGRDAGNE